jgi:hypothetical protein
MKIYRTARGLVAEDGDRFYVSATISLGSLLARHDLVGTRESCSPSMGSRRGERVS